MGEETNQHYPNAMNSISRTMRRPGIQRAVFSFAQQAPSELVRSKLSTSEIAHRAITFIPDEQLENIPEDANTYSLFQGFQATLPEGESEHRKGHRRRGSKQQKLLGAGDVEEDGPPTLQNVKKKRNAVNHKLEMMAIRKNLCSTEIREIDHKIANLNNMRRIVLDRLAGLENDELEVEHQVSELDTLVEDMQEEFEAQALEQSTPALAQPRPETPDSQEASFMSESIYEKLPSSTSPKKRRPKFTKRKSMPVLHEHMESGSNLKTLPATTIRLRLSISICPLAPWSPRHSTIPFVSGISILVVVWVSLKVIQRRFAVYRLKITSSLLVVSMPRSDCGICQGPSTNQMSIRWPT